MDEEKISVCSFCGRMAETDERFITGSLGGAICRDCVDLCQEIVRQDKDKIGAVILSPEKIIEMVESQGGGKIKVTNPGIGYWTRDDNQITTRGTTMKIS